MAQTNINAYKNELVLAERDLDRAQARVDGLRSYIESIEGKPKTEKVKPSSNPKKGGK